VALRSRLPSQDQHEPRVGPAADRPAPPEWQAKPRLRGRFHQAAFLAALPGGFLLVMAAQTALARLAAAIYAGSLVALYGVSAAYHRIRWSPRSLRAMKRLDHSMIYVLIAGTTTPLALLVLHRPWSVLLLVVVWSGAAIGIVLKMTHVDGLHRLTGALYVALGWVTILLAPQWIPGLSRTALVLVILGGLAYTAGAIVLLRNKPDPAPKTFGYHEIWHVMVVIASTCHYVAILLMVLPIRPVG
jgi:hemolysin III